MGNTNSNTLISFGSCGFFETRKAPKLMQDNLQTFQLDQTMDKSMFVENLSIDDNRNIKKLYAIMDLARKRQTIGSLIQNLQIAYNKLYEYHKKGKMGKSILKNSAKSNAYINTIQEADSDQEQSIIFDKSKRSKDSIKKSNAPSQQPDQPEIDKVDSGVKIDQQQSQQAYSLHNQDNSDIVNLSTVGTFSKELEEIFQKVMQILKDQHAQIEKIKKQKKENGIDPVAGTGEQFSSNFSSHSIIDGIQFDKLDETFHVSMEHFFFLFSRANEEIKKEQKANNDILKIKSQKNRNFGGCVNCAPCVSRQMDDEYFENKGISKDKKMISLNEKPRSGASDQNKDPKSEILGNNRKSQTKLPQFLNEDQQTLGS